MFNYWKYDDNYPAFLHAKAIIEFHAKSFAVASKLLPEHKRWGTWGVYSFCRYADNIVDKFRERSIEDRISEILRLKTELDLAYHYGESEHPVLKAFIATVIQFNIPISLAHELIEGVLMDTSFKEYETFDELYVFCYRVASVVGLMMTYVLGFENENTLVYAEKMGIAMQLTNILRDIDEDASNNRIYLPLEDLNNFGVSPEQFNERRFDSNFQELMKFQVQRARNYYEEAIPGIRQLSKDTQFSIVSAARIYGGILNKIEQNDFNPFLGRVYLSKSQKLFILLSERLKFIIK